MSSSLQKQILHWRLDTTGGFCVFQAAVIEDGRIACDCDGPGVGWTFQGADHQVEVNVWRTECCVETNTCGVRKYQNWAEVDELCSTWHRCSDQSCGMSEADILTEMY